MGNVASDSVLSALSFIGSCCIFFWSIIGAYITLRWGSVGIFLIWQQRAKFDRTVKRDLSSQLRVVVNK